MKYLIPACMAILLSFTQVMYAADTLNPEDCRTKVTKCDGTNVVGDFLYPLYKTIVWDEVVFFRDIENVQEFPHWVDFKGLHSAQLSLCVEKSEYVVGEKSGSYPDGYYVKRGKYNKEALCGEKFVYFILN